MSNTINEPIMKFGVEIPKGRRGDAGVFRNPVYRKIAADLKAKPGEIAEVGTFDPVKSNALRVAFRPRSKTGIALSQRKNADGTITFYGVYDEAFFREAKS